MNMQLTQNEELICIVAAMSIAHNYGFVHNTKGNYNLLTTYDFFVQKAESIAAEWVVAKYLDRNYDPFDPKHKTRADVADNLEVKHTKYNEGQLIINEADRASDIAILVVGSSPNYRIAGWIPVAMAQKPRYKHSKQPNWWVTQVNLQPIENLVRSSYAPTV